MNDSATRSMHRSLIIFNILILLKETKMDRRNFSLLAVTGFLGLAAAKTSQASSKEIGYTPGKKLAGLYRTIGNASSLGGPNFDNDVPSLDLGTNTSSGNGTMLFKKNGTGKGTSLGISIVQDINGKKYIEAVSSAYDFTYKMDKTEKVSIFIIPGSWKGQFNHGPRQGLTFEKILPDNTKAYFEGFRSSDGKRIEFSTSKMAVIETVSSEGGIWKSLSSISLSAEAVG